MQTLRDVVKWLQRAEESEVSMKTISLRAPWTPDLEVRVVEHDEEGRLPPNALSDSLKYFLETSVAIEVLEVLRDRPTKSTTDERKQVASLLCRKRCLPRVGLQVISA